MRIQSSQQQKFEVNEDMIWSTKYKQCHCTNYLIVIYITKLLVYLYEFASFCSSFSLQIVDTMKRIIQQYTFIHCHNSSDTLIIWDYCYSLTLLENASNRFFHSNRKNKQQATISETPLFVIDNLANRWSWLMFPVTRHGLPSYPVGPVGFLGR